MISNFSFRMRSFLPITAGLAVSQLIATLFVWQSNSDLSKSIQAIAQAGWLAIPAGPAAATLASFAAAWRGGVFFTLSVGTGLTLATWALLYLWQRLARRKPQLLLVPATIWIVLLLAVNLNGFALFPSLFVLCTPLATVLASLRRTASAAPTAKNRLWPVPLITLLLLTGLWATQFNQQLFIAIRDHLLLSNKIGNTVNDFYYRNTLYAAQAFKSFSQKTLRTGLIDKSPDARTTRKAVSTLARYDILTTPDNPRPDLTLTFANDTITLMPHRGTSIKIDNKTFFSGPQKAIRQFSDKNDRNAIFRKITFMALLVGFPVLLYILVDGALCRIAGIFVKGPRLVWLRAGICLSLGIVLFVPMVAGRPQQVTREEIPAALNSERWPTRVAALRLIEEEKMDVSAYPAYQKLIDSPLVVERYYMARALAYSPNPATYYDLIKLIKDPHPNVVCQAYYALGAKKQRKAIMPIKEQMIQSDHWYTQWYGYRAIRRLGWRQTTAKSIYRP